jgi:hypothetical protein
MAGKTCRQYCAFTSQAVDEPHENVFPPTPPVPPAPPRPPYAKQTR